MADIRTNAPAGKSDRGNRFLLIVDSDADSLYFTSSLLKRFEYQTFKAGSAKVALEIAAVAVPSLIITSLGLHDMSGIELIQQFRLRHNTAEVPIIALKRSDDLLGEAQSAHLGVDCFLDYPLSPELLYRAIQKATETAPRESIRVRKLLPVKVDDLQSDSPVDLCTMDLSEHGMFLRTTRPAARSKRLSLRIYLGGKIIPAEAEVVYSDRAGGGPYCEPGMGLKFLHLAPQDRDLIQQFVRHEITRGFAFGNA